MHDKATNPDYLRGQDFAREMIVCNAMPAHDLASYEPLMWDTEDYTQGVQDEARRYLETH